MTKTLMTALVVLALGCAAAAPDVRSLRGGDAADVDKAPETRQQLGKKPGLQTNIARGFEGQPPLIPHATDNFDEVTLEDNQCLSCHSEENYKKKNAPVMGESHYVDRDGKRSKAADSRRHACQLCHVPQFDAPPLVDNAFRGEGAKKPQ